MCICKDNLGFQTKEKKFHINAESGNDENQAQNVIKDSLIWNLIQNLSLTLIKLYFYLFYHFRLSECILQNAFKTVCFIFSSSYPHILIFLSMESCNCLLNRVSESLFTI